MTAKESRPGFRKDHPPRLVKPKEHDTYAREKKARDAFVCDECGVVQHAGKWRWGAAPLTDAHGGLCPACERIRDRYPAGTIEIPSSLFDDESELSSLIRREELGEREEHPLERVMSIETFEDGMRITTTGIHMARRLAGRLGKRFRQQPRMHYGPEQHFVHVAFDE